MTQLRWNTGSAQCWVIINSAQTLTLSVYYYRKNPQDIINDTQNTINNKTTTHPIGDSDLSYQYYTTAADVSTHSLDEN